jgi:hypothetical protein
MDSNLHIDKCKVWMGQFNAMTAVAGKTRTASLTMRAFRTI